MRQRVCSRDAARRLGAIGAARRDGRLRRFVAAEERFGSRRLTSRGECFAPGEDPRRDRPRGRCETSRPYANAANRAAADRGRGGGRWKPRRAARRPAARDEPRRRLAFASASALANLKPRGGEEA